jgi:hypothetical protein
MNITMPPFGAPRFLLALATIAATVALLLATVPAAAQSNGTISGTVSNATTGEPLAGATVTLSRFDSPTRPSVDVTTTTAADGRYSFSDVDTSDGFVYAVSVVYDGVLYGSGMLRFQGQPTLTSDIEVFEGTPDQSIVRLQARGLILTSVDPDDGILAITDVFAFEITGNRALIADEDGRTLRFSIPETALQVTPRPGFDFGVPSIEGATVFATSALRPGTANASLDYTLPYTGSRAELPVRTDYPTGILRILVPAGAGMDDVSVSAQSVTLLDQGLVTIGERDYHVWTTDALQPERPLTLTVSGLPGSGFVPNRLRTVEPALLVFAALAAASALTGFVVVRRGLHHPRPIVVAPELAVPLETRREELANELRELEATHEQGGLDQTSYRVERRRILEELRGISRQMRGLGDDE